MVDAYRPYAPLGALKPFAPEVWIVDGPEVSMRYLGGSLPFPTRMTLVRMPSGALWIHSPVAADATLFDAVEALGPVGALIAPNTLHYEALPAWQARFPTARAWGAPDLVRRARRPIRVDATLTPSPPESFEDVFAQAVVEGPLLNEVVFLHRPSATLILTDLIENFETARVERPLLRLLMRLSGAVHPDGKAPIDMQLSFLGRRREVRRAAETMIGWRPQRIILAHGRCYEADGTAELRRAFRCVLR